MMTAPEEVRVVAGGLRLAARVWGPVDGRRVLALHGWLDSAATWDRLAPLLCESTPLRIVALDLPGHGRSEHRGPGSWYGFADYVMTVVRVLDVLGWHRVTLLGHSMGGAVATLVAAVLGDRVRGMLLVEGLTPLTSASTSACEQLRRGIETHGQRVSGERPIHPCFDEIEAKIRARPWRLTDAAVAALASRAAIEVPGGWRFTHDPRLKADSLIRFSPEQVRSFLREVACPVLLFAAEDGLPFCPDEVQSYLDTLRSVEVKRVPGRHHVHLDAPERILPWALEFLSETPS